MDNNDFDSVSWQNDEAETEPSRPSTAITTEPGDPVYGINASGKRKASTGPNQAGEQADAVDLAGIGEARLDLKVDSPLKENDGTKDAYVSYLVTTNVRPVFVKAVLSGVYSNAPLADYGFDRPTSSHFPNLQAKYADASPILSFYTSNCLANTHNAPCHRCLTNTRWSTSGATALAPTSPNDEPILYTDFSNA